MAGVTFSILIEAKNVRKANAEFGSLLRLGSDWVGGKLGAFSGRKAKVSSRCAVLSKVFVMMGSQVRVL